MKRLFATVLTAAVLFSSTIVSAETIDLSQYSVDDLINLRQQVDDALYSQGGKTVLPFGEYVVGRDIAAGRYAIEAHGSATDSPDGIAWYVTIYNTATAKAEYKSASAAQSDAFLEAVRKEENGEYVEYPADISIYDYCTIDELVMYNEPKSISLEEGQMMVVGTSGWGSIKDFVLTIEQQAGLFMN